MKVRTQADIAQLEQVPVSQRIRHASVADLPRPGRARHRPVNAFVIWSCIGFTR